MPCTADVLQSGKPSAAGQVALRTDFSASFQCTLLACLGEHFFCCDFGAFKF